MNEQAVEARAGGVQTGRPTRAYARQRQEDLLECALQMFAQNGFELTTLDAVAAAMNMTKRTIYARYKAKGELFEAAVKRAIERWHIPVDVLRAADTGELETTLIAVGRLRVHNNLSAEGLRLQRIVTAEAFRFPEIFRTYEMVTTEVMNFIGEVFEKYAAKEKGAWLSDPELAASAFLSMVNAPARRILLFNRRPEPNEIETLIQRAVRLLLNGMRPR